MLSDKRYGLSVNLIACEVMPALLPLTINSKLTLDIFMMLLETLQDMLEVIDK